MNDINSVCISLPDWLVIHPYKKYTCVYDDIKPYIYNAFIDRHCLFINRDELKERCVDKEEPDEISMAITNMKGNDVIWGDASSISCWSYMDREETRERLVDKWTSILNVVKELRIDDVKRLLAGVHLISHGYVKHNNPCIALPDTEYIDKRLINVIISDLIYCPIHN